MKTLRLLLAGITALTLASNGSAISQPLSPADEKLGKVHFATSCAAGVAQEFDHAMALLHSFEFPAAITGFSDGTARPTRRAGSPSGASP